MDLYAEMAKPPVFSISDVNKYYNNIGSARSAVKRLLVIHTGRRWADWKKLNMPSNHRLYGWVTSCYAEFEWLYGDDSDEHLDALAKEIAALIVATPTLSLEEAEAQSSWGRVGLFDEDTLVDYIEMHLEEMAQAGTIDITSLNSLEDHVEQMRPELTESLSHLSPKTQDYMRRHSEVLHNRMAARHKSQYERFQQHRKRLTEEKDK